MRLSVIIVNYNMKELLEECLNAIFKNNIDFKVIVVDNDSNDGSVKMIKNKFPYVSLIENKKNIGMAKSINKALNLVKTEFVLVIHPDTIVMENTIAKMIEFMKEADIAGCRLVYPDGKRFLSCHRFPTIKSLVYENLAFGPGVYMRDFNYNKIKKVDIIASAFFMFRRNLIDKIGLFDEEFTNWASEWDFCYRAKSFRKMFNPDVKAVHYEGQSKVNKEMEYKRYAYVKADEQLKSLFLFYKKHYPDQLNKLRRYSKLSLKLKILRYFFNKERKKSYRKAIEAIDFY